MIESVRRERELTSNFDRKNIHTCTFGRALRRLSLEHNLVHRQCSVVVIFLGIVLFLVQQDITAAAAAASTRATVHLGARITDSSVSCWGNIFDSTSTRTVFLQKLSCYRNYFLY